MSGKPLFIIAIGMIIYGTIGVLSDDDKQSQEENGFWDKVSELFSDTESDYDDEDDDDDEDEYDEDEDYEYDDDSAIVEYPLNSVFYNATNPRITYMGRFVNDNDGSVRFNYPGSSIFAYFSGNYIGVKMRAGSGSFMVSLDNEEPSRWEFNENTELLYLDSLESGSHLIHIMLATEGYDHNPTFYGFQLCGENALRKKPTLADEKFLFIGNSITCGYGVEDNDPKHGFDYMTENHYYSYAAITARHFGVQWHSISRSGIGVYRNYGDKREGSTVNMTQQFHRTLFNNESYEWDHQSYQPDIIFINLGTNDTSLDNYDIDKLSNAYLSFYRTLRELYPNSAIVFLSGSMLSGKALLDVRLCLDNVLTQNPQDNLLYRFDMSPQTGDLGFGADYHPSMAQQEKMANELIDFIEDTFVQKN